MKNLPLLYIFIEIEVNYSKENRKILNRKIKYSTNRKFLETNIKELTRFHVADTKKD